MNYGTSKIVLSGEVQIGPLKPRKDEVLVVTTIKELTKSRTALNQLQYDLDWAPHELKYLDAYCFVREPSPAMALLVTQGERAQLQAAYSSNKTCVHILKQPNLCAVLIKKYESVDHGNVMDMVVGDIRRPLTDINSHHVRESIGWMLLDVILSFHLLTESRICHGDLKLNNLLHNPPRRRFKVNDFGLASTFDGIDFAGRFGTMTCPWYHPIFKAITTIDDKNVAKRQLQKRHAGLIDRYAFLGLVFQLGRATNASKLLSAHVQTLIKGYMLSLMVGLRRPPTFGPNAPATNQRERRAAKQRSDFDAQSSKWNLRNIKHFQDQKSKGSEAFCVQVHQYGLYMLKDWAGMFDTVVKWAWPHRAPRYTASIRDFMTSKRPAPIPSSGSHRNGSQFTTHVKRKR